MILIGVRTDDVAEEPQTPMHDRLGDRRLSRSQADFLVGDCVVCYKFMYVCMCVFCAEFVRTATMDGLPTSRENVETSATQHTPLPHEGSSHSDQPD